LFEGDSKGLLGMAFVADFNTGAYATIVMSLGGR
jgi:hypothetical protein